jgi:hypothetical protein
MVSALIYNITQAYFNKEVGHNELSKTKRVII